jgi:hypothetical protein
MDKLINWNTIQEILSSPNEDYKFRVKIEYLDYWKKPPIDGKEHINRGIMTAHIQHAIDRFLEKPENVAALMELILRKDNSGELTTPNDHLLK